MKTGQKQKVPQCSAQGGFFRLSPGYCCMLCLGFFWLAIWISCLCTSQCQWPLRISWKVTVYRRSRPLPNHESVWKCSCVLSTTLKAVSSSKQKHGLAHFWRLCHSRFFLVKLYLAGLSWQSWCVASIHKTACLTLLNYKTKLFWKITLSSWNYFSFWFNCQ